MARRGPSKRKRIERGRRRLAHAHGGSEPCSLCGGAGWATGCPACGARFHLIDHPYDCAVHEGIDPNYRVYGSAKVTVLRKRDSQDPDPDA